MQFILKKAEQSHKDCTELKPKTLETQLAERKRQQIQQAVRP